MRLNRMAGDAADDRLQMDFGIEAVILAVSMGV
jgi:hypothetical protein